MERTLKLWGERWNIYTDSTHSTCLLRLKGGFRCSWHVHKTKHNLFAVVSGQVGIKTDDGEVILTSGQTFTVPPGIWHEFRVYDGGDMIEEMYVRYDESDIVRERAGSKIG